MRGTALAILCAGTLILRWAPVDLLSTAAVEETLTAIYRKKSVSNTVSHSKKVH